MESEPKQQIKDLESNIKLHLEAIDNYSKQIGNHLKWIASHRKDIDFILTNEEVICQFEKCDVENPISIPSGA